MKRIVTLTVFSLCVLTTPLVAQIDTSSENLWRIYEQLEYKEGTNTETWFVGDRELVRDIVSRLLARGAVRDIHRNALSTKAHDDLTALLNDDFVEVMCVRRFNEYDLERIVLFSPHNHTVTDSLSPVLDKMELLRVLGSELYKKVIEKSYPVNGTSDRRVESQRQTSFDLYLNLYNPYLTVWQETQMIADPRETLLGPVRQYRWAVSLFGQLGHDYLSLPSWYKSGMIGGLKVSYIDNTYYVLKDKDYEKFSIWAGYDETINFSMPQGKPGSTNAFFKDRIIQGSGADVFVRGTWIPKYDFPGDGQYVKLTLEGAVAISEKNGYGVTIPDSFYSVRNYASFRASLRHLLGLFNVGTGVSWHDLHKIRQNPEPIVRLEPTSNHIIPFIEFGISQDGSVLQYAISAAMNFSNRGYSFLVVKSQFMLSNWIGVDVKYFDGFGNLPDWHYDSYIVISPIFRINY
jgi:hypothetical protein